LNFADDTDGRPRRKAAASGDSPNPDTARRDPSASPTPKAVAKRGNTPEVGNALRAAYQQTINEDIPPEFLDLLGKLG
jgi:hypothetical protein